MVEDRICQCNERMEGVMQCFSEITCLSDRRHDTGFTQWSTVRRPNSDPMTQGILLGNRAEFHDHKEKAGRTKTLTSVVLVNLLTSASARVPDPLFPLSSLLFSRPFPSSFYISSRVLPIDCDSHSIDHPQNNQSIDQPLSLLFISITKDQTLLFLPRSCILPTQSVLDLLIFPSAFFPPPSPALSTNAP